MNCRGGKRSGKTHGGAAKGLAFAAGKRELDGVRLPPIRVPNYGGVMVQSRQQQVESSQKKYLELLGDRAHKVGWLNKSLEYIQTIRVRPDQWDNPNPNTWSAIHFYCQGEESIEGAELDWVHGDETPLQREWRIARQRISAGRPLYLWITHTPKDRREWEWLANEDWTTSDKRELVMNVFNNRFLSAETLEHLKLKAIGDPLVRAVLYGEYVDTTGLCPFDYAQAGDGLSWWDEVSRAAGENGWPRLWDGDLRLSVWWLPEPGEKYWVIWDPSSGLGGLEAGETQEAVHSPSGLIVGAQGDPGIVARFSGHLDPVSLAEFGGAVARYYNDAECWPEMNYSPEATMVGLERAHYGNIGLEQRTDRTTGRVTTQMGFRMTEGLKSSIVSSLQAALRQRAFPCYSVDAVKNLRSCRLDAMRRLVQGPGCHTEDAIIIGKYALMLSQNPKRPVVRTAESSVHRIEKALGIMNGHARWPGMVKV